MIFVALAFLRTIPVGKQTEMPVNHHDGHDHITGDAEGSDAAQESEEQTNATEKFGADGQEGKDSGNVRLLREEAHGAGEAVAAKPTERLLSAMSKENHPEDQAKNGYSRIVGGVHELAEHERASYIFG